ncbi:MAG TPA: AMP-binding protein [Steroidobacteraceae bacterium]|nr:AMP-binding protein [Steroidobacteraceae bacterium]
MTQIKPISYSLRCRQHAALTPTRAAIVTVSEDGTESTLDYRELNDRVERAAGVLQRAGGGPGSLVIVSLPASASHLIAALAAWRLGACVLPLNPGMPPAERQKMLDLAAQWRPLLIVAHWHVPGISCLDPTHLDRSGGGDPVGPLVDVTPCPGKAIGSGGSTGRPKIIVDPKPWAHIPGHWGALTRVGLRAAQTQLIAGALHHNVGFFLSHIGLFEGHTLILPKRFDAEQAVDLIGRHRVQFAGLLPIMMQRIAKLPGAERRDFSSLEAVYHSGGVCPEWVKRFWLRLMPPSRVWELYGGTEDVGIVMINGQEWLERPGSVGRPYHSHVVVLGESGRRLPPNEVGEIRIRSSVPVTTRPGEHWPLDPGFEYIGQPTPARDRDGFASIGDLGWLDPQGYLYLADRRVDMIKSGGINIYPAEVESALSEHPEVQDTAVIGVPDPEWGQRVHALVQPVTWPSSITAGALDAFCRERLSAYKVPKSYELCQALPRDSAGKIRRSALREERAAGCFRGTLLERATSLN